MPGGCAEQHGPNHSCPTVSASIRGPDTSSRGVALRREGALCPESFQSTYRIRAPPLPPKVPAWALRSRATSGAGEWRRCPHRECRPHSRSDLPESPARRFALAPALAESSSRASRSIVSETPRLLPVADFGVAGREAGVDQQDQRQREQTGDGDPEGGGVGVDHHHVEGRGNGDLHRTETLQVEDHADFLEHGGLAGVNLKERLP